MKCKSTIIFVFLVSLILTSGCSMFPAEDEKLLPPVKEAREVEYRTEPVVRTDLEKSITIFAVWKSSARVSYAFHSYSGKFLNYTVSEGDSVKPGDVMAVLDIGDIDKKLRDMKINYQKGKLNYERSLDYYNAGKISKYDLQIAELNFEDITNKYNDYKEFYEGSLIIADIHGTVVHLMDFEKGDMVYVETNLVTLVKNDEIVLQGSSSKIRNEPIKVGDAVVVESRGETMKGKVSALKGTLVTIEPDRMLDEWKVGSTLKVNIPIESVQGVLIVDKQALRSMGGIDFVRVLVDGIAVEKTVVTGISNGRKIEIISGLTEGELVILN